MKQGIHPEYKSATIVCSCGNEVETRSTQEDIHVEICAVCHPFYTGRQKLVDTAGRVERFKRKYGDTSTDTSDEEIEELAEELAEEIAAEAEAEEAEEDDADEPGSPRAREPHAPSAEEEEEEEEDAGKPTAADA